MISVSATAFIHLITTLNGLLNNNHACVPISPASPADAAEPVGIQSPRSLGFLQLGPSGSEPMARPPRERNHTPSNSTDFLLTDWLLDTTRWGQGDNGKVRGWGKQCLCGRNARHHFPSCVTNHLLPTSQCSACLSSSKILILYHKMQPPSCSTAKHSARTSSQQWYFYLIFWL